MKRLNTFPFLLIVILIIGLIVAAFSSRDAQAVPTTGIFWVDPERNEIQGKDWMVGANVVVTVNDDEFPIAASENGDFRISFTGSGYNIPVGATVTATHLGQTISHVVTSLAFDSDLDYPDGTVAKGTAEPNSDVVLWLSEFGQFGRQIVKEVTVTANELGAWTYDFAADLSEGSFDFKDLHAFQPGPEETSTFIRRSQDPGSWILAVYPQINTIWGHDWPYGSLVVKVNKGGQDFTYNHGVHTGGDFRLHYDHHKINIEVGDTVTATIGELSLSFKTLNLQITSIDPATNIVQGTGAPNSAIRVGITTTGQSMDFLSYRDVTTTSNGTWSVDFSQSVEDGGRGWGAAYNITSTSELWAYQNTTLSENTEGRTMFTDRTNLIKLVKAFLITKMAEFAALTSNIAEVLDDPEKNLTFQSAVLGNISFDTFDIDELLITDPAILNNLANLVNISHNGVTNTISSKVDTNALNFLAEHGATLQFFDVAKNLGIQGITVENFKDYLNITVYEDGLAVGTLSDYFDWDNVTYDPVTDVLTLPVSHFTEYVLGIKALPETGQAIVAIVALGIVSLISYAVLKKYKFFD